MRGTTPVRHALHQARPAGAASTRRTRLAAPALLLGVLLLLAAVAMPSAQQIGNDTRDTKQLQDAAFAKAYREWTGDAKYGSPLVDHLPIVKGIPTPKDVLGYYVGAPQKLTYYADILKYYRALAAATPRVKVETIGKSDEGRELVVVWVSSDANIKALQQNRDNLAKLADPRGLGEEQVRQLIAATKPDYHLIGGLHSTESGPSEMLMELVYRIATETSPIITAIRNNVYVSVTPVADADGRDRAVDWFYQGLDQQQAPPSPQAAGTNPPAASAGRGRGQAAGANPPAAQTTGTNPPAAPAAASVAQGRGGASGAGQVAPGGRGGMAGGGSVPYWGKYVYHDNNRDINIALVQMRALTDWYFTAHPPVMHDLHESMSLLYTYSGGPPQNPNLDPLLFFELPWFSNWEIAQMTKWGMPGVYTHAFIDGWSPGYLGSVSYNHNGVMKMYETQSGRDPVTPPATPAAAPATTQAATPTTPPATPPAATQAAAPKPPAATAVAGGTTAPAAPAAATPATAPAAASGRGQGRGGTPAPDVMAGRGGEAGGRGGEAGGRGGSAVPSGRGGTQDREWYRGLPVPPNAAASFTRRDNTNYMETAILSSLQLTSMFPGVVVENFYVKSRNSIEDGRTKAPFGFVIQVQRDMTKAAELVRLLRVQGIEIGQATADIKIGDATFPAGSYVIKRDQPYGRLAKNLLEKQVYPDARLTTYDDSGWTMGLQMLVDVKEINDAAILKVATTPVKQVVLKGRIAGTGTAGLAVAHYGSNNMVALRYKLKAVAMKIAEKSFTADGVEFPAGSFIIPGAPAANVRAAIEEFGLTAAALTALPTVASHDAAAPRVAIYSQWTSTQDLGWYRLTFDNFGIPYDLIFKEQVRKGDLRSKYDVIIMAAQNITRLSVMQPAATRPQPYEKTEKYQFLGMYGSTPDMSGGFGQEGVDAFARFLEGGGTLVAAGAAIRFPIEFGWARTIDTEPVTGVTAQRPIVQGEVVRTDHPMFYGYAEKMLPMKYVGGSVLRVGVADQPNILARYVGGDASVLSGLMTGADNLRQKAFAADVPGANNGKGRVILFANNPVYRWQNHGEFNMMFNVLLNWAYVPPAAGR